MSAARDLNVSCELEPNRKCQHPQGEDTIRQMGRWDAGARLRCNDPAGGRLIVNEKEGRRVRDIFALFVHHRSLSAVVAELAQLRWKTKSWKSQNGTAHAGRAFAKASLRRLLTNALLPARSSIGVKSTPVSMLRSSSHRCGRR